MSDSDLLDAVRANNLGPTDASLVRLVTLARRLGRRLMIDGDGQATAEIAEGPLWACVVPPGAQHTSFYTGVEPIVAPLPGGATVALVDLHFSCEANGQVIQMRLERLADGFMLRGELLRKAST